MNYIYTAARRVQTGEPLYRPWPDYGPHVHTSMGPAYSFDRHPYPPFLASVLSPLTELPFTTFARWWYLPLLVGFWCYAWSLARIALGSVDAWSVLITGQLVALVPGTYRALSLGQIDPILWALFGAAVAVPVFRGIGFATSAAVKLYAGWPLLFAIRREGGRVLLPAMAVFVAGYIIAGLTQGFDILFVWARTMLPVVSQGTFNADNVSISFAGLRLARTLGWEYVPGPLPQVARFYLMTIGIAAPLAAGWLTRRRAANVQYTCVGCAAVLFAPLCWSTYLPLLLLPIAALFGERHGQRDPRVDHHAA